MTTAELLALFRTMATDTAAPYFCSDVRAYAWLAEAEKEAAIRKRLLRDSRTIALATPAAPTLTETTGTLTATTYSYKIVAYNDLGVTLPSTATTILTGASAGVVVTWTAVTGAIGYKVYGRTSAGPEKLMATVDEGTLTWTDSGTVTPAGALPTANTTADVAKISVTSGRAHYPYHASIFDVEYAYLTDGTTWYALDIKSQGLETQDNSIWREETGTPTAVFFNKNHTLQFNKIPDAALTLYMEVYRKPFYAISASVEPEISSFHHERLIDWVLYRYYLNRDADTYNPDKAKGHNKAFADYFGGEVDADLLMDTRVPQRNRIWL